MDVTDANRLGVGAPMWANRDWVGHGLPADTPPGKELEAYAKVCNAVEGNTTFYAVPSETTVEKWRSATGDGFRFMFKLPRTITHDRRLRNCAEEVTEFFDRMAPLQARLGPVAVQLPASFTPDDLGVLAAFLGQLPAQWTTAVEVRHDAFHAGGAYERQLNDLLFDHECERIIFDTRALFDGPTNTPEEIEAFDRKPRVTVRPVAIGSQPIVRFIGQTDPAANPAYLEPWVDTMSRWITDGRNPLMFIHTPDNFFAPSMARTFHHQVAERCGLDELDDPPAVATEASLW